MSNNSSEAISSQYSSTWTSVIFSTVDDSQQNSSKSSEGIRPPTVASTRIVAFNPDSTTFSSDRPYP